jgi:glutathione S-transferase
MLRIYGYAQSINVRKVLWACDEIDLPFERVDWGGRFASTAEPKFRAMNPVGMVPVIDDDGVLVWESNAIVRYLAASRARTDLLPADAASRAHVEQWMDWQASDFNNSWRAVFQALVRMNPEFQNLEAVEKSTAQVAGMVEIIDGVLGRTGAYIAGSQFTVADIVIGLSLHRWRSVPREWPRYANVDRYLELLTQRQAFRRYGRDGGP